MRLTSSTDHYLRMLMRMAGAPDRACSTADAPFLADLDSSTLADIALPLRAAA